jgi:hypothetical protein
LLPAMAAAGRSAIPESFSISGATGRSSAPIAPVSLSTALCKNPLPGTPLHHPGRRKSAMLE